MGIIKYVEKGLNRKWDVIEGLRVGGWPVWSLLPGLKLVDRKKSTCKAQIKSVTQDDGFIFIHYVGGCWQLLDYAIEQYKPVVSVEQ